MKNWTVSDLSQAKPLVEPPRLSLLEFLDSKGENHSFELLQTPNRLVFGGFCNAGFLESGHILREDGETIDETLAELMADLETYYNDGPAYVARIVFSARM